MSLLKKISKLFSKKKNNQLIAIALQKQGISLCAISTSEQGEISTKALRDNDSSPQGTPAKSINIPAVIFQQKKVVDGDFANQLLQWQTDFTLSGQAHLILNDQQTQIVQVDKPSVPETEICAALKWKIKDLVTISPDNMVLDYFDAPTLAGSQEKVSVVCASLSELKALVTTINQDNVELLSITTQEFAFANLLAEQTDAYLLICQQPNEEIVLLIVKEGQIHFQRRLRGFAHIASKSEDELVAGVIDNLSLEVQRSTDYYERQLKQAPIKELKVLLPIALEGFVARKLAENTSVAVSLLNLPRPYCQQRDYAVVIGAVLGQSKAISAGG
jgi:MSHA biogenesis protein MshI